MFYLVLSGFPEFIRPSCLPSYSDAGSSLVNDVVTATGWGKLSDDSFTKSDRLNFAKDLPVLANDACNEYYGIITDGHICIDSTGGHGVCNVGYSFLYRLNLVDAQVK